MATINYPSECDIFPLCQKAISGFGYEVIPSCDGCPHFYPNYDNSVESIRIMAHKAVDTIFKTPLPEKSPYALVLYVEGGEAKIAVCDSSLGELPEKP